MEYDEDDIPDDWNALYLDDEEEDAEDRSLAYQIAVEGGFDPIKYDR